MKNSKSTHGEEVLFTRDKVEIKSSPIHNYGGFATKDIATKEIIETCPVLTMQISATLDQKEVYDRFFFWKENIAAVVLGYGSIYNHSDKNNTGFYQNYEDQTMIFFAKNTIAKGEEILVDYGKNWFHSREEAIAKQRDLENKKNNRGLKKVLTLFLIILALSIVFPIKSFTDNKEPIKTNKTKQTIKKIQRTIKTLEAQLSI